MRQRSSGGGRAGGSTGLLPESWVNYSNGEPQTETPGPGSRTGARGADGHRGLGLPVWRLSQVDSVLCGQEKEQILSGDIEGE